jgi:RNA recognition motif-containing protein
MVKIFIGGFPLEMTELELVTLFSAYGDVSTIKIVRDRKTRICKGYAFMEMTTEEGARNAIAGLDGHAIGQRELTVRFAEEKAAPKPRTSFGFSRPRPGTWSDPKKKPQR